MALSNGRELLERVMEGGHAIVWAGMRDNPVKLIIHPDNPLKKPQSEVESDYLKFRQDTIQKLDRYEAMRETRKNEERHTAGLINEDYDFDAEAKPDVPPHERLLGQDPTPRKYVRADELANKMANDRKKSVIEKLTAPPETVLQHLDRLGVSYTVSAVGSPLSTLTVNMNDLNAAEGNR